MYIQIDTRYNFVLLT